jgi:hypothetical protein
LNFSNANNVTWGTSAGGIVTASVAAAGTTNQTGPNVGVSNIGNTLGTTGTVSIGNYIFAGGNNITLSQSSSASNGTLTISGPNMFSGGVSTGGLSFGSTGMVSQRIVFAGVAGVFLSQSTDAAGSQATISIGDAYESYYQNIPWYGTTAVLTQTSGSSIYVQPFLLPYPISASYMRLLASYNDAAVGTGGTTSANTTCSAERYTTVGVVIYSEGVGASSRSIQSFTSTSVGITGRTIYSAGANGSQYTMTLQKTYPATGANNNQYTTSYAVSSGSIVVSSNSNTLFIGLRFLDIPFGISLSPGNYWLGVGASAATATNSSIISFATANTMAMTLAGASQANVSVGILGAATSASDHQLFPGIGLWTTNASGFSKDSIGLNSISQVVSNPLLMFQFIRQA